MGATNAYHRPLRSGIEIRSGKRVGGRLQSIGGGGTLTGLATRNSDGQKVLVTNLHVMTGSVQTNPSGVEEMHQEAVAANKKVGSIPAWDPDNPAWVPILAGDNQSNVADVAYCELDENVDVNFTLHDHPTHTSRQIIEGVVEPVDDDKNPMKLTMLGAVGGEGTVTVDEVNDTEVVNGRRFTGLTILDTSKRPVQPGDSGAACLSKVGENQYKMSCIEFASILPAGHQTWAFPASVAQRKLGITFGNRPPVAKASVSSSRPNPGATVTLNGSGSADPDQDTLTYHWEQAPGVGVGRVKIANADKAVATFTAPSAPATLTFKLTVTDPYGSSDAKAVSVTVNRPPAANAGPDQMVAPGASVDLNASGSSDPDGDRLAYLWEQLTGPDVTLSSRTAAKPTFTAPSAHATLGFRVIVTDSLGAKDSDAVAVRVSRRPVADAGSDQTAAAGASVTLDGSGSSDPDGDTLTYSWEQYAGETVTLSGTNTASASFTAPDERDVLQFRLTVTDSSGLSNSDTVSVSVEAAG